ncbi:MAG: DUF4129 domain-containing protein [Chloroflexi bacterium]|nr:DUF4129 domain-containing protein [Chloroflexota bacterium]
MNRSWRNNAVTSVALFLETCSLFLVFRAVAALLNLPDVGLSFWLVLLALTASFMLMTYILSVNVKPQIRGLMGLGVGIPAILVLASVNTGLSIVPLDTLLSGPLDSAVTFVGTVIFLIVIWWRGTSISSEDVSLDSVRAAFLWGLGVLFGTALVDSLVDERVVNGFLVIGFFAVGLLGLSLARFSSETGETHNMSREWVMPILVSVAAVVVLGLLISGLGLGGLDDVTRGFVKYGGDAGFWILRPLFLLLGLFAGVIVSFVNWISSMVGGGDFTALINAQADLDEFHQRLREQAEEKETSTALITILKWTALGIAITVAGWVIYKLFRSRRFMSEEVDVEETRESLFTWKRANDDVAGMFAAWWKRMFPVQEKGFGSGKEPETPREFYHGFLGLASRLGRPRHDWETPNEHQRGIWGLLPTDPVFRIVQRFQRFHYGNTDSDESEIGDLQKDWKELNDFADQEDL